MSGPQQHENVFVGVGANLGGAVANCRQAIDLLAAHPAVELRCVSSFYETEPVGNVAQDWFVNAVAEIATTLEPGDLLRELLAIERRMGRTRAEKWGPRVIDLDILAYGGRVMDTPELVIPHPEMARRRFVLAPFCEIQPGFRHPLSGRTVRELLAELPAAQTVRRLPLTV